MELYKKEYQKLSDTKSRVMIAKAIRQYSSNSDKLALVHISPVTHKKEDGYTMEENHSGDRCIRLVFTKHYGKNQTKAMKEEIKQLAKNRLNETIGNTDDIETKAFIEALKYLSE